MPRNYFRRGENARSDRSLGGRTMLAGQADSGLEVAPGAPPLGVGLECETKSVGLVGRVHETSAKRASSNPTLPVDAPVKLVGRIQPVSGGFDIPPRAFILIGRPLRLPERPRQGLNPADQGRTSPLDAPVKLVGRIQPVSGGFDIPPRAFILIGRPLRLPERLRQGWNPADQGELHPWVPRSSRGKTVVWLYPTQQVR